MAYTKLHQSILQSTVWAEDHATFKVWITLMVLANEHGEVEGTVPGLTRTAMVSRAECERALAKFQAPDPDSRTADDEGRRIVAIEGGWHLLNHEKYRKMASKDDAKAKTAERTRRWRERRAANAESAGRPNVTATASPQSPSDAPVTQARDIAEAEADKSHESRTDLATESNNKHPLTYARASERPTRVSKEQFEPLPGRINGADEPSPAPMADIVPEDWKPSPKSQKQLKAALPWMTEEIARARFLQFLAWAPKRPPRNLDAAWLAFMSKTNRKEYPDGGFNG